MNLSALEDMRLVVGLTAAPAPAIAAALDRLAAAGDPRMTPIAVRRLLDEDPVIAGKAHAAVDRLVRLTRETHSLRAVADSLRWDGSSLESWEAWGRLTPGQLQLLAASPAVSCAATLHANGHVREAALAQLQTLDDGSELPFVIARLGDSVDQVRERARLALSLRRRPELAGAHVRALPAYVRLVGQGRADYSSVLEELLEWLLSIDAGALLVGALGDDDRETRRVLTRRLGPRLLAIPGAAERALASRDAVVRRTASATLLDACYTRLLENLLASHDSQLRRHGLLLASASGRADDTLIRPFLLDSRRAVRSVAQHLLKRRGFSDLAQAYLDELGRGSPALRAVAVAGLGDLLDPRFVDQIRSLLRDPFPPVRVAALWALVDLDPRAARSAVADAAKDPSPRMRLEARRVARRLGLPAPVRSLEELWQDFDRTRLPRMGLAAVDAELARAGPWHVLVGIVSSLAGAPAHRRPLLEDALDRLAAGRDAVHPTHALLDELERATNVHASTLGPARVAAIGALLKHWRWVLGLHRR